jgi:hypothetical protein
MGKVIKGSLIGGGVGALVGGLLALILWGLEIGFRKDPPVDVRLLSEIAGAAAGSIVGAIAAATNSITASLQRESFRPHDGKLT